ncbi:MAG TPA: CHAT domain-containing tetratricopeptide repeat protein [Terriglobales bacterium]
MAAIVAALVVIVFTVQIGQRIRRLLLPPAEKLLRRADELANNGEWLAAAPVYKQAEVLFRQQRNPTRELYAKVSQAPAEIESPPRSLSDWLAVLNQDLRLPGAADPHTRLRILEIKGQIETNYDAALAHDTWVNIRHLALQQREFQLANRAYGEDAIALYMLGDMAGARKQVVRAYAAARYVFRDRAGQVRFASLIGTGMAENGKYQDALRYLDEAISLAKKNSGAAYPSVAINAKIEALRGLKQFPTALTLCADAMRIPEQYHLRGRLYQVLETRAHIFEDMGDLRQATRDYGQAVQYARELGYWRGLTETDGPLARVYEKRNELDTALASVNEALDANRHIPREMYFAPRNLAIKAEILKKLGRVADSNNLYERSLALIDSLLITAPTPNIVNSIITSLSDVYSGYFSSLCEQGKFAQAFSVIERAHGRVEAVALQSKRHLPPHAPTAQEQELTALNLQLIATGDQRRRDELSNRIGAVEDQIDSDPWSHAVATQPASLEDVQNDLLPQEVLIEYVLAEPVSYALAITRTSATPYALSGRSDIEPTVQRYTELISKGNTDTQLAHRLFEKLLRPIRELHNHTSAVFVPDRCLHLLPMTTLYDGRRYVLATHITSIVPAASVFHILRTRARLAATREPFVGVAPWTERKDNHKLLAAILNPLRGGGPRSTDFVPLPQSEHEVEMGRKEIDGLLGARPNPAQLLIGPNATEENFKRLPLADYRVFHLALHGYADIEHPDRSALVFAPDSHDSREDGLLQIREIRRLHLNAALVVLSACNTGLGPAGEAGISNLSTGFLQAGAQTVVSSLWAVADRATSEFMDQFYLHLASNESKAEALRNAELHMLTSGLPPYYWASFEIMGDPDGTVAKGNTL